MIDNRLNEYRSLHVTLNPPASADQLGTLEAKLAIELPYEVRRIYQDHDGERNIRDSADWLPLRLMTVDEAVDAHAYAVSEGLANDGLRLFYTDDNSNYVGLHIAGPMQGMICFVDHDELDTTPIYRNIDSFLAALINGAKTHRDWADLTRDYPVVDAIDQTLADHDWEVAKDVRVAFESIQSKYIPPAKSQMGDQARTQLAMSVMALTPPSRTETLIAFTYDVNPWVQEYACNLLGLRRYTPALQRLTEMAAITEAVPNPQLAARLALSRMRG